VARVVTVGGGFGGLATALFSARRGHEVVVIDRDAGPPDGPADTLATWSRPGVVQASMAHGFLARSTRVLLEEAPDVLEALAEIGVGRYRTSLGPGMEDDVALASRRPVYEGVMRRVVEHEPGVEFLHGSVRGLVAVDGASPRITGVRLSDGATVHGDLVVDAAGRRSASGRWLRELGFEGPSVEDHPCELHYFTRHYRLSEGESYPSDDIVAQPLPYAVLLVFIGDNRTFSVAAAVSANDPARVRLQDAEVFERFIGAVPTVADWVDRAVPISELTVMAGLANRQRRLMVDGRCVAPGLALVGDASHYTNPSLGQGVSLTLWMAQQLADRVEQAVADPEQVTRAHEAWLDDELGPRYERQLLADRETSRQFDAGWRGAGFLAPEDPAMRYLQAVTILAAEDEELTAVTRRVGNLLEHPRIYWDDPAIATKVEAFLAGTPQMPTGEGPLPRRKFDTLVGV
jgi:2-polyprenyl-6-methoxyphenol hydroxylase-like FAD-dependent oxidoreductase